MSEEKQPSDLARLMSYKKKKDKTKVTPELKVHIGSYLIILFLMIAVVLVLFIILTT